MAIFIGVKLLVIKLMSHGEHKIQSRDIPHTFQLIYRKDILYIKVWTIVNVNTSLNNCEC